MATKSKQDDSIGNDYFSHVRNQAEKGEAWAQKAMGDIHYFGIGVNRDEESEKSTENRWKQAAEWYATAADQSYAEGQHALGRLYYFGEGVEGNFSRAAELYQQAAEQGLAKAQYDLGGLYYSGKGVAENKSQTAEWYTKAANNEYKYHKDAWYPLGLMYLKGNGVAENWEHALLYFMLASRKNGMEAAQAKIDEMHWRGGFSGAQRQSAHERLTELLEDFQYYPNPEKIAGRVAIAPPPTKVLTPEEIYERVWQSVVVVEDGLGGQGSGVIIQPNIMATNLHVVADALDINTDSQFLVRKPASKYGIKEYPYLAELRPGPQDLDFCLLDVDDLWGCPVAIRKFETLSPGERVYALGAPKGQVLSLTSGIISQLRFGREIQTDAPISPGSSGGGLFDAGGNLIGLTTSGVHGEGVEGMQFAVSAEEVLEY